MTKRLHREITTFAPFMSEAESASDKEGSMDVVEDNVDITTHAYGVAKTRDVTLILKKHPEHEFQVSKAVLSAFSVVFCSMFNSNFAEQEEDTVQLDLSDVTADVFKFFVDWIYGLQDFSALCNDDKEDRFVVLAKIADVYDVQALKSKLTDKANLAAMKWSKRIDDKVPTFVLLVYTLLHFTHNQYL